MDAAENVLRAGYRLDRYELLSPIATGGMATVWLARLRGKRGFEKFFAVKTIRTELVEDTRFQEMFLDEARIASGIQHPNVAQILDLGEQQDVLFIVMEWVDGDSLAKIRKLLSKRGSKLPTGLALRLLADACAGLHAAHELHDEEGKALGIVHRDVSPQNILVATSGAVKVIDFGIAKAQNRQQGDTRTGVVKGKIQYMAPEQVKKGRKADRRSDVWALGVCLHELVAGKPPNDGDDDVEVIRKLMTDEAPPFAEGLPAPILRILERSMALDPDARFPTAAGMQRALEGAMKELGEGATSEDVAGFMRAELPELAERRRQLLGKAMDDARMRVSSEAEAREEVAFAPTVMSERSQGGRSTDDARAIALTKRKDPASGPRLPVAAVSREDSHVRAPPTEVDEGPIEIPKRSRTGLWVLLAVVVGSAVGALVWPDQVRRGLALIGIGSTEAPSAPSAGSTAPPPPSAVSSAPQALSTAMSAAPRMEAVTPPPPSAPVERPRPEPTASHTPRAAPPAEPLTPAHGRLSWPAPSASAALAPLPSVTTSASAPAPSPPEEDPNNPYSN